MNLLFMNCVVRALNRSLGRLRRRFRARLQSIWELTPFHDKVNAVLWSTGPMLLTDVYKVGGYVVYYTGSMV